QIVTASMAALILGLLGVNLYRAASTPVTSAEAVVYSRYVAKSPYSSWTAKLDMRIGAVYPLLARTVKQVIGVSELSLRLPAVFGALLFWVMAAKLARRWFGHGWIALAAIVVVF